MTLPPDKQKQLGKEPARSFWVQTERAAHEAWAKLAIESPRASALMHLLVANMGAQNAVVISQKLLAQMMGCHERTVRRAAAELAASNWIQIVQVGAAGSVNAYVVNSVVACPVPAVRDAPLSLDLGYGLRSVQVRRTARAATRSPCSQAVRNIASGPEHRYSRIQVLPSWLPCHPRP